MPIGTSRIGVLGAGVVPGGCQTFNASGTFTVPPGVSKVNITGKGGTGNPGNAGNSGNPGNPGTGGGGGGSGASIRTGFNCGPTNDFICGNAGGYAYKSGCSTNQFPGLLPNASPIVAAGGNGGPGPNNGPGNPGSAGASGNAGNAGSAGNPGNTGNTSSGLCKNFTGGAGGNAGAAGAAGNGGSGGPGGSGTSGGGSNGGPAGSGGGAGGNGYNGPYGPCPFRQFGGAGGGGAGVTNDGQAGQNGRSYSPTAPCNTYLGAIGGTWSCTSAPFGSYDGCLVPRGVPRNVVGGISKGTPNILPFNYSAGQSINAAGNPGNCQRRNASSFNPFGGNPAPGNPTFPTIFRSGGAGASGGYRCTSPFGLQSVAMSGGGGGGARGVAGNAGGSSSTPSGSAATPSTFNCVSVTPGGSYPITVASPGGQIVISWNPQ